MEVQPLFSKPAPSKSSLSRYLGCPLSARTSRSKLVEAVACPSLTVRVIVALPDWLPEGVILTVRLLLEPPKVMLLLGAKARLDDEALTTRLLAGISGSPTVKLIGPVEVSWVVL